MNRWSLLFLSLLGIAMIMSGILIIHGAKKEAEIAKEEIVDMTIMFAEFGYMEGQIDAIKGDIRVMKVGEDYEWIRSPWNGNQQPTFQKRSLYNSKIED